MKKASVLVVLAACSRFTSAPADGGGATSKPAVECTWTGKYAPSETDDTEQVPELRCTSHATSDVTRIGFAFYFYDAAGEQIWSDPDAPGKATKHNPDVKAFYSLSSSTSVVAPGKSATVAVGPNQKEVPAGTTQIEVEVTSLSYASGPGWDGPAEPFPSGRPLHKR